MPRLSDSVRRKLRIQQQDAVADAITPVLDVQQSDADGLDSVLDEALRQVRAIVGDAWVMIRRLDVCPDCFGPIGVVGHLNRVGPLESMPTVRAHVVPRYGDRYTVTVSRPTALAA